MRRHVIGTATEALSTVVVGRGIDEELAEVATSHQGQRVAILSQPSTRDLGDTYGAALSEAGLSVTSRTLPDGDEAKTLSVVEDVYRFLNDSEFTRDDLVIGVGGGALTDVAGFIAGTYLRGVSAIYVPTTLLAAVDASIGGKTAINVGGKNLAGLFAHPAVVLIDIDVIDRLPIALKREGSAEALKTGFIEDMEIVEAYERDGLNVDLEDIVNRSAAVKVAVVNEDFHERGKRAILNYGHTVGHAVEATTNRTHAESVSIGTVAAGAASKAVFGFSGEERQRAVLGQVGLPLEAPEADLSAVRQMMDRDKKRDVNGIRMVLLRDFGSPELVHADDATVRAAFHGIGLN